MTTVKYAIVERDSVTELVREVNGMMTKGWRPAGGLTTSVQMNEQGKAQPWYGQAMTFDEQAKRAREGDK